MKSAKKPLDAIIWIKKKARRPIRIYASIYASREKQALSYVNDYSLCNWKTRLFCYFVAQGLFRYLLALLLRIALMQQMIDAAVYAWSVV